MHNTGNATKASSAMLLPAVRVGFAHGSHDPAWPRFQNFPSMATRFLKSRSRGTPPDGYFSLSWQFPHKRSGAMAMSSTWQQALSRICGALPGASCLHFHDKLIALRKSPGLLGV